MCACVRACACVRVRACVRACVCVWERARVCMCVCSHARAGVPGFSHLTSWIRTNLARRLLSAS